MNEVVTKMTKNVSNITENVPKISMPKLSVPKTPVVTMGKVSEAPSISSPSIDKSNILKETVSKTKEMKIYGFSLMNIILLLLVLVILAALGINIFMYLSEGTDYVAKILEKIAYYLPESVAKTFRLSAIGTGATGEFAADTLDDVGKVVGGIKGGLNRNKRKGGEQDSKALEKKIEEERIKKEKKEKERLKRQVIRTNKLREIALKQRNEDKLKAAVENRNVKDIEKYETYQPSKAMERGMKGKGWCYIGSDRGFRTCLEINENDICNSAQIFKSQSECENTT